MPYVNPLLGIVLLLFGRPLYWVFVAFAGFLMGAHLASVLVTGASQETELVVGLIAGGLGAVLAMAAQRIAFSVGGFFAGGYLSLSLLRAMPAEGTELVWFLIGGIAGALIAAAVLDWAIVLLSSLVGAGAIVQALPLDPLLSTVGYVLLVIVGVAFQGRALARKSGD